MPRLLTTKAKYSTVSFKKLKRPLKKILEKAPQLESRCNRPLQMDFNDQLNALIFFHLEEHTSGRHLIQNLKEDDLAREHIAPEKGISKSSFFEAMNDRGLEQFLYVFNALQEQARTVLPQKFPELGQLVAIDGSLIDSVLSMTWADYRGGAKKAKTHIGFDINRGIPRKIFLTAGNDGERPFVSRILLPGETGVLDRGYQQHKNFDLLQSEGKHFVCRIKANTTKTCLEKIPLLKDSIVFYDAKVLLGQQGISRTEKPLRLVGYEIDGIRYWVASDRFDLTAEQIAFIYKLRWDIETFFAWWKRHLKVYHLISRSPHGLMIQMLAGLITYLLLAIYCYEEHGESVSIKRVRQLRNKIHNESRTVELHDSDMESQGNASTQKTYASP
ncbi:IS4 family transposase [Desulfocastanea catecholica]